MTKDVKAKKELIEETQNTAGNHIKTYRLKRS